MTSPFADPDAFCALPRLAGLALSPDGARLATTVATLDPQRQRWTTSIWELDPAGVQPAVRLTRGRAAATCPIFTPSGDLLFVSARPDDEAKDADDDAPAALWALPAHGGEAHILGTRPGGVAAPAVARTAGTVLVTSATLPGAADAHQDAERRKARKERKVTAVLHTGVPVRYWDADLGPDEPRLLVADRSASDRLDWRDLTPQPGHALFQTRADITPDGTTVVTTWNDAVTGDVQHSVVVAIDVATGARRVLVDDPGSDAAGPVVSPDGRLVAFHAELRSTPHDPVDQRIRVVPVQGGQVRTVAPGWDRWASSLAWDGDALIVTADEGGRAPVFRVELSGAVTRLTGDAGAYGDVQVAPDGSALYAVRSSVDAPPAVVRLDPRAADQQPVLLRQPAEAPALPGRLLEVSADAADGTVVRSWLVLPEGASAQTPAPLLLWVHGGPLGSWNSWSWRWNPWLYAARGYAVLLPDPALSTGYGMAMIRRGWGAWGGAPYRDVLAATDAALQRPDLDADRTAMMGGSFGGYMANWIAGHTDRFRAIVTHASLWNLQQFGGTTDAPWYWGREMSPQMAAANDPSAHADDICTPMLVIHGDKDYRVPVGEGLRLWWDLVSRAKDPAGMAHRFLYFPDENHWVLTPGHHALWNDTVLAFLGQHVLGEPETVPELLR